MTLVLPERDRLVAPTELASMPPLSIPESLVLHVDFSLPESPAVPSHVLIARTAVGEHPGSAAALVRLAQAEQSIGEDDRALDAANGALALLRQEPDTALAVAVVQLFLSRGEVGAAANGADLIQDAQLRNMFAARIAVHRGAIEEALAALEGIDEFDALALRGWIHLGQQDWTNAIRSFRRALVVGRPSPAVLTNLGYAYAAVGSLKKATKVTLQAQALDEWSPLIALNLMTFYRALGDRASALAQVAHLQERHPDDLQARFAEADLLLSGGDVRKAYSALRRARTSALWASAGPIERAQLTANLAFVAWRLGERPTEQVRAAVIAELENTGYKNRDIASMLPPLMSKVEDADALGALIGELERANPGEPLDQLRVHLATLRCDFEEATQLATEWAERELFDPVAAAQALYLLADVTADYEKAISLGRAALRRTPSSMPLRNNLAYALALAGRVEEARRVLPADPGDSVTLAATRALTDVLGGHVQEGFAGYKRAYDLAQEREDHRLALLVHLNWMRAVHRYVRDQGLTDVHLPALELPDGWRSDPRLVLIDRMAERERIPCVVRDMSGS
jgi:tetratricopeptide (TPR) repeat protein